MCHVTNAGLMWDHEKKPSLPTQRTTVLDATEKAYWRARPLCAQCIQWRSVCVCVRACTYIPAACLASRRWMRRCVKVSRPRRAELLNVVPRHSSGIDCRIAPMNGWNNPGRPAPAAPTPPLPCELILCGSLCNSTQTTTLHQEFLPSVRQCTG